MTIGLQPSEHVNNQITPTIVPSAEHPVSRDQIQSSALSVLNGLKAAGFAGYLVGGCVRDLLLGREPKDFDVVTDARPEEVRSLFRNARMIGRRFRLVHVRFGREIIEVSTFRALSGEDDQDDRELSDAGRILRDNIYGSREEDALRRDFTVNALYCDARDFSIIDYVNGIEDTRNGVLRTIGDPATRYREDPVRMLRAVRFAARLGFRIDSGTEKPISELGLLLADVPPARRFEEMLKLFHSGVALETFELLRHYDLFRYLFPLTEHSMTKEEQGFPLALVPRALANTDERVNSGKPVTPAFLLAVMLWYPMRQKAERMRADGMQRRDADQFAVNWVLQQQAGATSMPRRFSTPMREIWGLQPRLERRIGKRVFRLLDHPRFRAAYDFLVLRSAVGEVDGEVADWWTRFQEVEKSEKASMVNRLAGGKKKPQRRRSRKSGNN